MFRDPDLGRDRTTKALGRRDWDFFTTYPGRNIAPVDVEAGTSPWGSTRRITRVDRWDRTLGIPARDVTMWPKLPPRLTPESVNELVAQIIARPEPSGRHAIRTDELVSALQELAPAVYGQHRDQQHAHITQIARARGLPADALLQHARGIGEMIAKTTHRSPALGVGEPSLHALLSADLAKVTELYLARAALRQACAWSDPDLPRLWMIANAFTNRVPVDVMLTSPAQSHGIEARVVPEHRDLVGWDGLRHAVEQMEATVTAARRGGDWLAAARGGRCDDLLLGVGVVALTRPATAHELAGRGITQCTFDQLRRAAPPSPRDLLDLSDQALKAMCDRNGWLLGTTNERTERELIERHLPDALDADLRRRLATGDLCALADALACRVPAAEELDARVWRANPAAPNVQQRRMLVDTASREALRQFAGYELTPRANLTEAVVHRFPERVADIALRVDSTDQLGVSTPAATPSSAPHQATVHLTLGLGLPR
jgi:hypothetical protein